MLGAITRARVHFSQFGGPSTLLGRHVSKRQGSCVAPANSKGAAESRLMARLAFRGKETIRTAKVNCKSKGKEKEQKQWSKSVRSTLARTCARPLESARLHGTFVS